MNAFEAYAAYRLPIFMVTLNMLQFGENKK